MLKINGIDITDAVTGINLSQQVNAGAAVMSFSVLKSLAGDIFNGDTAELSHNGKTLFIGKIFSRSLSRDTAELTALDSLRGLKAVFPVTRKEQPAGEFIRTLAAMAAPEVKIGGLDSIQTVLDEKQFERLSLIELIYRTLDEAEASHVLRDEEGCVYLRNWQDLKTELVLDGANLLEFKYEKSAGDSCNYVKLISNSVQGALSAAAVASDPDSVSRYGRCCYIAEVDEKNPEQLMLSAKNLLEKNSGEKQKLWVTAIGDVRAIAGNLVFVDIDAVGRFWAQILSAEHVFEGKSYTVRLQLQQL